MNSIYLTLASLTLYFRTDDHENFYQVIYHIVYIYKGQGITAGQVFSGDFVVDEDQLPRFPRFKCERSGIRRC